MNNNTRIVSLVLAGLAAGGAIWYLLGTEKGRTLTNKLGDSAKNLGSDIKNKVSDRWNEISSQAGERAGNVVNKASDMGGNISNKTKGAASSTTI